MIAISTYKHETTGKQMVLGWRYVSKVYANKHPEIPGSRMYIEEKNIPPGFYNDCTIYAYDNKQLVAVYPERIIKNYKTVE